MASTPSFVLACAQVYSQPGDCAGNASMVARIAARVREAVGPSEPVVIVFPETFLQNYASSRPVDTAITFRDDEPILEPVRAAAREHHVAIIVAAAERRTEGLPYNAVIAIDGDGSTAATYRKTHLWNGNTAACETEAYHPGGTDGSLDLETIFPVFTLPAAGLGDVRFACLICFDIEFPETARFVASRGAEVILVPTATGGPMGSIVRTLTRARACENHVAVAYCNYPRRASAAPANAEAPIRWCTESAAESLVTDSASESLVIDSQFFGETVAHAGDGTIILEAEPAEVEQVLLGRCEPRSASLMEHIARNPYLAARRRDLLDLRPAITHG